MAPPTWRILKQYLEEQIATGTYPVGAWLPSVRDLAGQLSVNRNTVSKVYQALGRDGVLEVERGRGVRVVAKPAHDHTAGAQVSTAIESLVHEASLAGVTREWLLNRVNETADAIYGSRDVQLAFVECTEPDARQIAGDLERHLGVAVTPVNLADFEKWPAKISRRFDLIATTLFHLQEVRAVLPEGTAELAGIHHTVSHETILEIAKLRPGIAIVVVCPNQRTIDRVRGVVEMYARGDIYAMTPNDEVRLRQALSMAEVAIDTATTHEAVIGAAPSIRTITISFHIEQQSIEDLRMTVLRLARLGRAKDHRALREASG